MFILVGEHRRIRSFFFPIHNIRLYLVVGKQYAVLIAINKYQNWPALRNPVKDAKEIQEILSRRYYLSDFMELYDEDATKAGIIKLFNKLLVTTKPEDSVLIFYAGHGHLDNSSNAGFWIPVDGGTDVDEQANWLPNNQIRGFISNIKARHVALIADSCFSGDILNPSRGLAPTITVTRSYGSLSITTATAGTLYLDGRAMGDLPAGAKAKLDSVEVGERNLEVRYADGQVEKQSATVEDQ